MDQGRTLLAFLKGFEERNKLLEEVFELWLLALWYSDTKSYRRVVKDVFVLVLQLLTEVIYELVLPSQLLVALKVVEEVTRTHHK